MFANSSNTSPACCILGAHLNITADFSLNAAEIKIKYLLVRGVTVNLEVDPRYSFY